ncbi:ATP-dependent DNA helicase [Desulfobacteraceae bacterium SEEP-SAG9]|nr:ATP-dependent DNA helicase [Desulfobacteraceae bacterium SEEP-SAG9]
MRRRHPIGLNRYSRRKFKIPEIKPAADARLKPVFASIGIPDKVPFKPDPFQLEALSAINRSDCLVTVPTGSGKTWIAEQAIARIHTKGGKSWYASPLKALSNAKYAEFKKIFGSKNIGILTGDRKENLDAPIIVGTTEILRNQLYDAMHRGETLSADLVVLDEAHFLGDEDRGVVWEEILIYLPIRIPILLLSATIGNADQIAGWISSIRSRKCVVIEETKRPVPLFPLFFHPSGMLLPLLTKEDSRGKKRIDKKVRAYLNSKHPPLLAPPRKLPPFGAILKVLKKYQLLPALFFLKSRADCDNALERCTENRPKDQNRKARLGQRINDLVSQYPYAGRHRQLWHLEHLAVGAHHSGQLPVWKLVLETLMTEGLLDAVFATSTVAAGVNFPARTMVFLNSDRFNGREFLPLNPTEFHQMTGRAGRRGMDNIGFAVAIPGKFMDIRLGAKLIASQPSEVLSQIRINFSMALNLLLSHTPDQIEDLLKKSFATYLIIQGRKKKAAPGPRDDDHKFLWENFLQHLSFLKETEYVAENDKLTETGMWASQLRVDQPLMIAEGLKRKIFPESDPAILAAIIASFVDEQESDDKILKNLVPRTLLASFQKVKKGLQPFTEHMAEHGFAVRPLFLRPAATIYAWATGQPWEKVLAVSETAEGNLAMLILRTADNLRHIRTLAQVFPEAAKTSETAIELILRDPVVMDYDL